MSGKQCCLSYGDSARRKDLEWYQKFEVDVGQLPKIMKRKKDPYKKSRRKKQDGVADSPSLNPVDAPPPGRGISPIQTRTAADTTRVPSQKLHASPGQSAARSVSPGRSQPSSPLPSPRAPGYPGRRPSNVPPASTYSSNAPTSPRVGALTAEALSKHDSNVSSSPGSRSRNSSPARETNSRKGVVQDTSSPGKRDKESNSLKGALDGGWKKFLDVAAPVPRTLSDNGDALSDYAGSEGGASSVGSNYNPEQEAALAADYGNITMPETVYVGGVFLKANMAHYHFNRVCGGKVKKSYPAAKARAKGLLPCTRCVLNQSEASAKDLF